MPDKNNIFIVAGESSGDMHSASLIKELNKLNPDLIFTGIGGNEMKSQSVNLLYETKDVNFIGFSSVIKNIKKIKSILDNCIDSVKTNSPDAVILVDYPGFNLKLITKISKFYKGKIIYYISPQLWAWHKSRVNIIKKFVDLMIVVFPFEVDFYKKEDITAEFAGHPLVERIDTFLKYNVKNLSGKKIVSVLPGSRKDEIERMLPILLKATSLLKKEFNCEINIICSTNFEIDYFRKFTENHIVNLVYDTDNSFLNYRTILNSDLVITKSGTSTVECALIGTPFCVVYKTGKINYSIGRKLIRVNNIAMVNILLQEEAVKEFLQDAMTPDNIFEEGKKILTDTAYGNSMKNKFIKLRKILTEKNASQNAAMLITNLLN